MAFTCLEVLAAAGITAGPKSGRETLYHCPQHDDIHASLSVNPEKDVWMCGPCGKSGTPWQLAAHLAGVDPSNKAGVSDWLRSKGLLSERAHETSPKREIAVVYPYQDLNGNPLFEVVRYEPKGFSQRRPDGKGGYISNLDGVTPVPYRLPDWNDREIVYVVEGEKDVDNLWSWGIPATCNPMGAGNWKSSYNEYFKDKKVVIIPDNDTAGEKHATEVARQLIPVASSVKIVRLQGLPLKGDFSDWMEQGGTQEKFAEIVRASAVLTIQDLDPDQNQRPTSVESAETPAPDNSLNSLFSQENKQDPMPVIASEAFYGLAGKIVEAIDPTTEADPIAVLTNIVAAFGNLTGNGPHVRTGASHHPARLYLAQVGATATARKGTAWYAIDGLIRGADPTFRCIGGISSGEGVISTVEAQVPNLNGDKRVLFMLPEFSQLLTNMHRRNSNTSETIRQAWDSTTLSVTTRNNPLHVEHAHVSIIGHVTGEELLQKLEDVDRHNGFANRFIWMLVKRSKYLADPDSVPQTVMAGLQDRLADALNYALSINQVLRDATAKYIWNRLYPALSDCFGVPETVHSLLSRATAQVIRLSLLYALLDKSPVIRVDHLFAALAIWDYSVDSVLHFFGNGLGNRYSKRILSALSKNPDGLADDDLGRLFGGHHTAEKNEAIQRLYRLGLVEPTTTKTGGRDKILWKPAGKARKARKGTYLDLAKEILADMGGTKAFNGASPPDPSEAISPQTAPDTPAKEPEYQSSETCSCCSGNEPWGLPPESGCICTKCHPQPKTETSDDRQSEVSEQTESREWSQEELELLEERAAIMEIDGGVSEEEAEAGARDCIVRQESTGGISN